MSKRDCPDPDLKDGINYWNNVPASLDGVLGGFGSGTLPRVDALGSRQFLLALLPDLCTVPSAIRPLNPKTLTRRVRAVDVGAGIGRVTSSVLLHIVQDVVLLEPVEHFVKEAFVRVAAKKHARGEWKGIKDGTRSVTVLQGTLQDFDPAHPLSGSKTKFLGRAGYTLPEGDSDDDSGFDVIWCQWCLGHLSDEDLVAFFKRAYRSLRVASKGTGDLEGVIVVKENLCSETTPGQPRTVFDADDSSLTRSDAAWKKLFSDAGLTLIKEEVQLGLPGGLYPVKAYALR